MCSSVGESKRKREAAAARKSRQGREACCVRVVEDAGPGVCGSSGVRRKEGWARGGRDSVLCWLFELVAWVMEGIIVWLVGCWGEGLQCAYREVQKCPSIPFSGRCCRFNASHVILLRSMGVIIVSQVMAQSSQKRTQL